jgi:hypothetical protein
MAGSRIGVHAEWKSLVPETWIEVIIEKDAQRRSADIRLPNGRVVKLQSAPLSPQQIRAYESFFGNMLWIFDVREARETMDAVGKPRLDLRKKEMSDFAKQMDGVTETSSNYRTFCWSIRKGTSRLPPGPSSATLATARSLGSTSYTLNARPVVSDFSSPVRHASIGSAAK